MEGKNNDRFETHPTSQTLRWYLLANSQKFYVLELMAALILLALGLTEKPPALKANNLSVPVEVSVHSALGRGVMGMGGGGGGWKGKSYNIWLYKVWIKGVTFELLLGAWKLDRLWTWHDNPISATDIELSYQLHMLLYTECMLIVLIGLA